MKFNKNADPVYTTDLWYDLTDGGYILSAIQPLFMGGYFLWGYI